VNFYLTSGLGKTWTGNGVGLVDFDNDGDLDIFVANDQFPGKRTKGKETKTSHELTGDLHLRQGDIKKAIEAYEKALRQSFSSGGSFYDRINFPPEGLSPKNRGLMQKLSQAQIRAGNFDKARQVLDNLSRAEAAAKDASKSKAHEKGSLPFSAQLVISVKKANLDAVAAGKITREEFKKQANVYYFDADTLKQKESNSKQKNGKN